MEALWDSASSLFMSNLYLSLVLFIYDNASFGFENLLNSTPFTHNNCDNVSRNEVLSSTKITVVGKKQSKTVVILHAYKNCRSVGVILFYVNIRNALRQTCPNLE